MKSSEEKFLETLVALMAAWAFGSIVGVILFRIFCD